MRNVRGFTLVELSVVIIIIGLLIAGINAGMSMIKQAKINSVITELRTILTGFNTFKAKYNYLPGDFPHAFAIWGTKCGANSAECDGDGNGLIKWNHLSNDDCPNKQEPLHAWQHMNFDSIIEGKFTGVCSGSGYGLDDSYNSKLGGNAIWIIQLGMYSLAIDNTQILSLTNGGGVDYFDDWAPILIPTEAQNIDSKIDDGLPLTGSIIATEGFASANTCKTSTGNQYVLIQPEPSCVLGNIIYNVN